MREEICLFCVLTFVLTLSTAAFIPKGWVTQTPLPSPATVSSSPPPAAPSSVSSQFNGTSHSLNLSKSSTTEEDDYYSPYPEYTDLLLNSSEDQERRLLEAAGAALPDDSLADSDLHDHDLIDSVMYVYFGGGAGVAAGRRQLEAANSFTRPQQTATLMGGAALGLVAQVLTLVGALRRLRRTSSQQTSLLVLVNTELALAASNLVFLFGVQRTTDPWECELVAVTLHYLHLVAASWLSSNCLQLYLRLRSPGQPTHFYRYCLSAWGLPALALLVCRLVEEPGYEYRDYCWMSVERGMLLSFMAPLSLLMMMNTGLCVVGLRLARKTGDVHSKHSLRTAACLLPLFAISWFLGVLALENSASSILLPVLFLISYVFLNWFMFSCWLRDSSWRSSDETEEDSEEEDLIYGEEIKVAVEEPQTNWLFASPPPMPPLEDQLQMDLISTISS